MAGRQNERLAESGERETGKVADMYPTEWLRSSAVQEPGYVTWNSKFRFPFCPFLRKHLLVSAKKLLLGNLIDLSGCQKNARRGLCYITSSGSEVSRGENGWKLISWGVVTSNMLSFEMCLRGFFYFLFGVVWTSWLGAGWKMITITSMI